MDAARIIVDFLLAILTLLFGGCNLIQLKNNTALKRKLEAEADRTKYDAQNVVIEGLQNEIKRLQDHVADRDEKYELLNNKYTELLATVADQNRKIVELNTKIAQLENKQN